MPSHCGQRLQYSMRRADDRLYRICLFDPGAVVPRVQLISAAGDEQVVAIAVGIDPSAEREVWDRHRLVAYLPAGTAAENPSIDQIILD